MLKVIEREEMTTDAQNLIGTALWPMGFSSDDGMVGKVFLYDDVTDKPIPDDENEDCYLDLTISPASLGFPEHSLCTVEWFNK